MVALVLLRVEPLRRFTSSETPTIHGSPMQTTSELVVNNADAVAHAPVRWTMNGTQSARGGTSRFKTIEIGSGEARIGPHL